MVDHSDELEEQAGRQSASAGGAASSGSNDGDAGGVEERKGAEAGAGPGWTASCPLQTPASRQLLVEACALLEQGLLRSGFNFQFRLLLVRLYHRLGACPRLLDHYDALDVKHVQHDSLSHLVLQPMLDAVATDKVDVLLGVRGKGG